MLNTIYDRVTINGGYGQSIADWALGDDRVFVGDVASQIGEGDQVTDVYLTLKSNPNVADAYAIAQIHVTQQDLGHGSTVPPGFIEMGLFSGDYQGLVSAGPVYYLDFRVLTGYHNTYTVATAALQFLQNVTQTNVYGTPGPVPMGSNGGQPRFRGWTNANPETSPIASLGVQFVAGDWFRNNFRNDLPPQSQPTGWVCIIGGSPGTWMGEGGLVPPLPTAEGLWAWNGTNQRWEQTVPYPQGAPELTYGYNPSKELWVPVSELWPPVGGEPIWDGGWRYNDCVSRWQVGGEAVGVTDGTDALPGEVGEYIAVSNLDGGGPSLSGLPVNSYYFPLGSVNIPAGDWQIGGQIDMWFDVAGAVATSWGYFYLGPNDSIWPDTDVASDRAWTAIPGPGDHACFNLGPIRINSTELTQIMFQGQVGADVPSTWGCDYVIWARRVR